MIIKGIRLVGGTYVDQPQVITNNLVMYLDAGNPLSYPGSGTSWTDTIGSKVFTLENGPTYDSGNGGSIVFNPLSGQFASATSLPSTLTNWTVEAWLYHDATNMSNNTSPNIVTEVYFGNPLNFALGNTEDSFPYVQSGSFNGGWASTYSGVVTLTSLNWYQVVGTWNGTDMKLYVNSSLVNTRSWPGFTSLRGGNGIRLMSRWDNAQFWGGKLSIVRIYDTDITAAGVSQNFNANKNRFGI